MLNPETVAVTAGRPKGDGAPLNEVASYSGCVVKASLTGVAAHCARFEFREHVSLLALRWHEAVGGARGSRRAGSASLRRSRRAFALSFSQAHVRVA